MKWNQLPYDGFPEYDELQDTLIRQSSIGQMQLCPGRIGFIDHPKYLAMISEPLAFGTCVHRLISEDMTHGQQQDRLLLSMNEWIEELLVEQYDWSLTKVPNVRDFFAEITVAYRSWVEKVKPTLVGREVLAVEQEFRMFLAKGNNGNIFLKGTADLVLADTLMDWKTSGRAWAQVKADISVQASLYMPLHRQALGVDLKTFWFWVFNRQAGVWTLLKTKRTIAQIDAAMATAIQYGLTIEAKAFPCTPVPESSFNKKRGWYCSTKFCSAWNACNAKFMNDGVNEKEVAVRSW